MEVKSILPRRILPGLSARQHVSKGKKSRTGVRTNPLLFGQRSQQHSEIEWQVPSNCNAIAKKDYYDAVVCYKRPLAVRARSQEGIGEIHWTSHSSTPNLVSLVFTLGSLSAMNDMLTAATTYCRHTRELRYCSHLQASKLPSVLGAGMEKD